ncbi:MAG: hypothetical protein AB2L24_24860 [Mangrovibacterium sp.]
MNAHEAREFGIVDEVMDDPGDIITLETPDKQRESRPGKFNP